MLVMDCVVYCLVSAVGSLLLYFAGRAAVRSYREFDEDRFDRRVTAYLKNNTWIVWHAVEGSVNQNLATTMSYHIDRFHAPPINLTPSPLYTAAKTKK